MSSGIQYPRRAQTCRPGDRLGADPRRQGPEARYARHAPGDGARLGDGRRGHRPGRLLRDLASHDARRPRLLCRRYPPLLRGQHSRAPCPIPRRLRSPTPRFPTPSSSPTRAGGVPARRIRELELGAEHRAAARWSAGPSPRPGGCLASRWRCNAVAGFPARSGFSCGDADLAFTPNKKRVVCIPPAFFVYLDDDPEIAAHTPLSTIRPCSFFAWP